ncbi:MAG: 2'-5' RNA ligase family protein, partial [bacterium]|nr:2'-5' RNA ligase family protein [bacterium]
TSTLDLTNSALTLPLHISLRISFQAECCDYKEIIKEIKQYYQSLASFEVQAQGIEKNGSIIWIRIESNKELQNIHTYLIHSLSEKYGIGLHEFDKWFTYHVTLFMDADHSKVAEAYDLLSTETIPFQMTANRFVIGISETGKVGEYRVVYEIEVN